MRHIIILLALLCASCNASLPSIKPYKMDIQQGNVVTSKMMLQLKPGMTKSQVRFIMGTPLIQDGFHPDRWDYFYQMRKGGKIIEQRRVIMEFEGDKLKRVRGDVIPAGSDPSVPESRPAESGSKKSEDKGLLDSLMFWKDDEEATKPHEAPQELMTPEAEQKATPAQEPAAKPEQVPATESESTPQEAPAMREPDPVEAAPATEPAPAPVTAPEAPAETVPETTAAPATESQPTTEPAAKAAQPQTSEAAEPAPEDDLPPEGAPGYFERMLEKIGF